MRPDKMSWEEISLKNLPKEVDWRNMNGTNYLSWNQNHNSPEYCASCWATSVAETLSDRFNIKYLDNQLKTLVGLST